MAKYKGSDSQQRATHFKKATAARDQIGADNAIGAIFGQVGDAVHQIDDKPIEHAKTAANHKWRPVISQPKVRQASDAIAKM